MLPCNIRGAWVLFRGLGMGGKPVQARRPEPLVSAEPLHRFLHRPGGKPDGDRAARLGAGDQPGMAQHVQVLHHRRQLDRERT